MKLSGVPDHSGQNRRPIRCPFVSGKHIRDVLLRRHGSVKPNSAVILEGSGRGGVGLDTSFGFSKSFPSKYKLDDEFGRGQFGHTSGAKYKRGDNEGQQVAVKVIPKVKAMARKRALDIILIRGGKYTEEDVKTGTPKSQTQESKKGSINIYLWDKQP